MARRVLRAGRRLEDVAPSLERLERLAVERPEELRELPLRGDGDVFVARLAARRVEEAAVLRARETVRFAPPAARLAVELARRVDEDAVRRVDAVRDAATCRACFVRESIRFSTALTSARVLARLTCVCSCLIAARAALSASFTRRSTCRRRSGGTRFSASRSARRPALTARPTRPERRDVRFLVAMPFLHE